MPPEPQDTPDPAEPNFEGHEPRRCGEHRTVGSHRAWCHDCGEWCYPSDGCRECKPDYEDAFARLASAVGLPGAGVDDIEAAMRDRIARPTSLGEWLALCPDEEAPTYRAVKRLLEQERAARAENERLRAELAEAHDALALALRSGVWKVGPVIAARIHSIKEALGRPAGVAAPGPLAEARDTGTGEPPPTPNDLQAGPDSGPAQPDPPGVADVMRLHGGIDPAAYQPSIVASANTLARSPVPPAPDEARDVLREVMRALNDCPCDCYCVSDGLMDRADAVLAEAADDHE